MSPRPDGWGCVNVMRSRGGFRDEGANATKIRINTGMEMDDVNSRSVDGGDVMVMGGIEGPKPTRRG